VITFAEFVVFIRP